MSIRDLNDNPYRRRPAPPPAPMRGDPWAERSAPEHEDWAQNLESHGADERGSDDARGYRVRSEDVWQAARAEYAAGFSAEAVCAQFDLGLSAFRQRARREGWRRRDAEDEVPAPLAFPSEPDAAPATPELVDLAWRSAAQAIRRGRAYEARAWMRLWNELKAVARNERTAVRLAEMQAAREAEAGAAEEGGLHSLHPEDGVQSSGAGGTDLEPSREASPSLGDDARAITEAMSAVRDMIAATRRPRPP
jgi:hypothetical protein